MDIPLVEQTMEILAKRKGKADSIFIFSSHLSKSGHMEEPKRVWSGFLRVAELKNVRLHDLRRTLGSWQVMTGASSTIVGKTLGHKSPEATAVYARMNLDPIRLSMQKAVDTMLQARNLRDKITPMGLQSNK
jgi:integrase